MGSNEWDGGSRAAGSVQGGEPCTGVWWRGLTHPLGGPTFIADEHEVVPRPNLRIEAQGREGSRHQKALCSAKDPIEILKS